MPPVPKVYMEQGGDTQVVASGGTVKIESGGVLDVQQGARVNSSVEIKTGNFTLTAADNGKWFIINATDVVVTLPATALGLVFHFIVQAPSATTGFSISPVAADSINAGTDDKDLINSAATDAAGDSATVVGDGVVGWLAKVTGTWAAEA